jgi:hypothetical protein
MAKPEFEDEDELVALVGQYGDPIPVVGVITSRNLGSRDACDRKTRHSSSQRAASRHTRKGVA